MHDTQGRGERRPAVLHRGLTTNRRDLSAVLQEKEKSARMPMGSRVSNVEIALKSKMKHVKQRTLAFFQHEAAGGIVLLAAAVLALILANSPLHHAYELLLETPVTVRIGERRHRQALDSLDQRRPDGGVLPARRSRNQARDDGWRVVVAGSGELAGNRGVGGDGRSCADLRRFQSRGCQGPDTGGQFPLRPTSRSRSACWRCWGPAYHRR